ncbi:MAG: delta(1)-pyrroline-2-carboxylate reductase family protein, partial [Chloroflexi bacterium]|nr:delta(1)-pyrroline-2-carboxylate reductase family protein [Chloroflexota bacterium]
VMPATGPNLTITKLVTVHPNNAALNLPSVQASVLVLDTATGQQLYLLPGAIVTARRTAALSLLAAQMLALKPAGPLLIVGAGIQGRAHLEAFVEGLGVREVFIASRTFDHAEQLAADASRLGVSARAVRDPAEALDVATLIVTATTSAQPVLPEQIRSDALICAVGAYLPTMAEVPASIVRRSRLYVDTLEGAQAEAGDLIQAGIDWQQVTPLEQVESAPPPTSGPILFKSVGHALWDLAAATLIHEQREDTTGIF